MSRIDTTQPFCRLTLTIPPLSLFLGAQPEILFIATDLRAGPFSPRPLLERRAAAALYCPVVQSRLHTFPCEWGRVQTDFLPNKHWAKQHLAQAAITSILIL